MNKILVVDDELNMRLVLSAMLKKEGFAVATAKPGSLDPDPPVEHEH